MTRANLTRLTSTGANRVQEHAPFGARTTYRVGGTVRALVTLSSQHDLDELGPLIAGSGLAWRVMGNGSNLLVADGEHDVIGIVLTGEFSDMSWRDDGANVLVNVGAALDLPIAARRLSKAGVAGFEWAVGVPGTFGGAVVMNAGGHGSDMNASVDSVTAWDAGASRTPTRDELAFGYRTSAVTAEQLVTSVALRLHRGAPNVGDEQIREIVRWRREHQPGGANGGSVFRNPDGDHAARLIESAGCKGRRHGSAVVSEKHANFIIADANGRANDVYELLCIVRDEVARTTGVRLHSEHRFLGFADEQ
jgi:UDP-N-acetylmuramate dehydrogenase